ncbi:MAG: methylated-DNA--[protein]-cysteine S-methyltransferase [Candidatus Peribacteraceae bacterium]|nr:methylated-DNA--[protein]-cysteine S-methyltransferase [Candidatus Peribacteraceae bacterium]
MSVAAETTLATPLGPLLVRADRQGILEVRFVRIPVKRRKSSAHLRSCVAQLRAYFSGRRRKFRLGMHPQGTAFQQSVWRAAARVPFGATVTYGVLARRIRRPQAARAVGSALKKNPLVILIPCHRIVLSSGDVGSYAGGARRKQWLLAHEQ